MNIFKRIYHKLFRSVPAETPRAEIPAEGLDARGEKEKEAVGKGQSWLTRTQTSVKEVWLLCMEPFM